MKIFSAAQIRACDAYSIHASGISSLDLMERAAARCMDWITAYVPRDAAFIVVCGSGNNGGDGLALTRLLYNSGYSAKAFVLKLGDSFSPNCLTNLQKLEGISPSLVSILPSETFITDVPANIIIIDAILGTGLNRPVQAWVAQFIEHINELPNRKIAIDIPSGLPADSVPDAGVAIIKANDTLSFQFYKRSFLHPETGVLAGNVHILDIGLDATFIKGTHTQYRTIDKKIITKIYKPRSPFSHKGTYGGVLMIGGSYGKMGAVVMSSKAALRAGAGTVTALVPECGYSIMQTAVPEVMCRVNGEKIIQKIADWDSFKAIGVGPGLDTGTLTVRAFTEFIDLCKQPVVIDADGLNILGKHQELLNKIPAGSVLTPHPKEFTRMFGDNPDSMLQLENARTQAMRYNLNIVLKGHNTVVVTPEGVCWYNLTGNAGMATGGAGDVLTGIITGLMAQGYTGTEAAILGVYLHGLAGDFAAGHHSMEAMIAGDITDQLGKAFQLVREE